jgi:hypothetical protein
MTGTPFARRTSAPLGRLLRVSASTVALLAVATVLGCTRASPSREVAERFVDLYYARMNLAEAAKLCSGAARTRLDGELHAVAGVPPDAPGDQPRVTWALTGSTTPTPTTATYTYRVTAHTADVGIVATTLELAEEDGRWVVTGIGEQEAPPAS